MYMYIYIYIYIYIYTYTHTLLAEMWANSPSSCTDAAAKEANSKNPEAAAAATHKEDCQRHARGLWIVTM